MEQLLKAVKRWRESDEIRGTILRRGYSGLSEDERAIVEALDKYEVEHGPIWGLRCASL